MIQSTHYRAYITVATDSFNPKKLACIQTASHKHQDLENRQIL